MRRRSAPPPSAQQMIREYLGRVSVAATKVLPKGDRLLFVVRTRAAIQARVGPLPWADAGAGRAAPPAGGPREDPARGGRGGWNGAGRGGPAAAPPPLGNPKKEPGGGPPGPGGGGPAPGGAPPPP